MLTQNNNHTVHYAFAHSTLEQSYTSYTSALHLVSLRFSKSCKRSVSAGFVKKSANSALVSVLDEGIINFCIQQPSSTVLVYWWAANAPVIIKHECTSQASVPRRYRCNVHYRPTCHVFDNNEEID